MFRVQVGYSKKGATSAEANTNPQYLKQSKSHHNVYLFGWLFLKKEVGGSTEAITNPRFLQGNPSSTHPPKYLHHLLCLAIFKI